MNNVRQVAIIVLFGLCFVSVNASNVMPDFKVHRKDEKTDLEIFLNEINPNDVNHRLNILENSMRRRKLENIVLTNQNRDLRAFQRKLYGELGVLINRINNIEHSESTIQFLKREFVKLNQRVFDLQGRLDGFIKKTVQGEL